ncbi:MAG: hypothetical protein FWF52_01865 [Candidatus Azobacteroides sp.]|nr:hypothetical protein [Candidatus Azobacteroides sp.]
MLGTKGYSLPLYFWGIKVTYSFVGMQMMEVIWIPANEVAPSGSKKWDGWKP